jgi:hypothetical protein
MTVLIQDYRQSDRNEINRSAVSAFGQYEQHYEKWATFQDDGL